MEHSQAYNLLIKKKPVKPESTNHRDHYTDERKKVALDNNSFKSLLPYPCLLAWWSGQHFDQRKLVGKFVSHIYRYHALCERDCQTIEKLTRKALIERIYLTLKPHAVAQQETLL